MGLSSAIQIGRTALNASQLGIQTASNNLANASTPGYNRRVIDLRSIAGGASTADRQIGLGVEIGRITRQVDEALLSRLNIAVGHEAADQQRLSVLSQIEFTLNELTDQDLSSELSSFLGSWSELANGTDSAALVIEQGDRLAGYVRRTREDLVDQRNGLDNQLDAQIRQADDLLSRIAQLNQAIVGSEVDAGEAGVLRDSRDQLVRELSQYLDITAISRETGAVDVLVGSTPLVQGGISRGVDIRKETRGSSIEISVSVRQDGERLGVDSGSIGALLTGRDQSINRTIENLDELASALVYEINKLHSTGVNASGLTRIASTRALGVDDVDRALNGADNVTLRDLPFRAVNGGFDIIVTDPATGARQTTRIDVDLDGIDDLGQPGTADDTSLRDLATAIDSVNGVSASVGADGLLRIEAGPGSEFSFADDTSGVLAVLGVNAYFTGTDARDFAVDPRLGKQPSLLTRGRYNESGTFVENGTSLAIADLQNRTFADLGGRSVGGFWRDSVQRIGTETAAAAQALRTSQTVREGLDSQRLAFSGVNEDEEAINLLSFQRQFQGAARVISTADELLQELLALV